MIYPVIVITVASLVVALISIFLLPQFARTLKDIAGNKNLPLPSEILMGFSASFSLSAGGSFRWQ